MDYLDSYIKIIIEPLGEFKKKYEKYYEMSFEEFEPQEYINKL